MLEGIVLSDLFQTFELNLRNRVRNPKGREGGEAQVRHGV